MISSFSSSNISKYQKFEGWFDDLDKFLILRFFAALAVVVVHTSLPADPKLFFGGKGFAFLRFLDGITSVQFFFIFI